MLEQQTLKSREFIGGHPVENEARFAIVFSEVESQAIDLGARAGLYKKRGTVLQGKFLGVRCNSAWFTSPLLDRDFRLASVYTLLTNYQRAISNCRTKSWTA